MIELLGKRPFEKHDPYDEAMLGAPPAAGAPLPRGAEGKQQPKTNEEALGEKQGMPVLPGGIEGGEGVPVPEPRGIEPGVASSKV